MSAEATAARACLQLLIARDTRQVAPFARLFLAYSSLLSRPRDASTLTPPLLRHTSAGVSAAANSSLVERLKSELNESYRQNAAQARTMLDLMNQYSEDKAELNKWMAHASNVKADLEETIAARAAGEGREAVSARVIATLKGEVTGAREREETQHVTLLRANARLTETSKEVEMLRARQMQVKRELDKALEVVNRLSEEIATLYAQCNSTLAVPAAPLQPVTTRVNGANVTIEYAPSPAPVRSKSAAMLSEVDDEVVAFVARKPSTVRRTVEAHTDGVNSMCYTSSGSALATTGGDGTVKLWDAFSVTPLKTFRGPTRSMLSVAFSFNSEMLVGSCNDSNVWVWQYATERLLHKLTGHTDKVGASAVGGLDRLISGSHDRTLKYWDLARGFCLRTQLCGSKVNDVQFTRGGKLAVSAHLDKFVRMYDMSAGECVHEIAVHSAAVTSLSIAPASNYLLTNSRDNTLKLLDLRYAGAPEPVRMFRDERYRNACDWNSAALSADESLVAVGGADGRLFLWNALTGMLEVSLLSLTAPVSACEFHPAGQQLAVAYLDKHIQLWE